MAERVAWLTRRMIRWHSLMQLRSIRWLCLGLVSVAAGSRPVTPIADPLGALRPAASPHAPARPDLGGPAVRAAGKNAGRLEASSVGRRFLLGPWIATGRSPSVMDARRLIDDTRRPIVLLVNNEPLNPADEMIAWTGATDKVIQFYQARAAKDPHDASNYSSLGAAYVQKTRETGDITYYDLAEKTLRQALRLNPDERIATTVTTRLALVFLAKHQYQDALAYAQKALDHGTGQLFPYAIVGDAYFETGEYEKASLAYSKMANLQGAAYPHSRLATLRFLRGDVPGALEEMERGVEALLASQAPRENVAWAESRLGEFYFHAGELTDAAYAYRNALRSHSQYHSALAGLARVRAAQGAYDETVSLYQKALAIIPLPEYAAALGDVFTKIGRTREAKKQYALVEYIGYLNTINKVIYNRELALFYADHDLKLKQSLELAERELKIRRDIYTYDVLAWALYKNGKPRDASVAMAEALKLGTRDARLFFHAGMIHRALGDADKARDFLQRALAANPRFHPLQAGVAERTLSALSR